MCWPSCTLYPCLPLYHHAHSQHIAHRQARCAVTVIPNPNTVAQHWTWPPHRAWSAVPPRQNIHPLTCDPDDTTLTIAKYMNLVRVHPPTYTSAICQYVCTSVQSCTLPAHCPPTHQMCSYSHTQSRHSGTTLDLTLYPCTMGHPTWLSQQSPQRKYTSLDLRPWWCNTELTN